MIIVKIQAGLGNQLFQYAAAKALSLQLKVDFKVDLSFYEALENKNAFRLDKFSLNLLIANQSEYIILKNKDSIPKPFRVLNRFGFKVYPYYRKTHLIEDEILNLNKKKNIRNNYYIEGWFGNEKFFKNFSEIIRNDFNADFLLNNYSKELQEQIKSFNSVAVHIRRGDYLNNSFFKNLPLEYYYNAIKEAKKQIDNPIFYFFSNDIEWVKESFKGLQDVVFIDRNSTPDTSFSTTGDIDDLMLMRSCKHQIIANSTFSWWGAWLNEFPEKKVFFPSSWYNDIKAQTRFQENGFIPDKWTAIKIEQ